MRQMGRNAAVFGAALRCALACGAPPDGGDGLRSGPRRKPSPATMKQRMTRRTRERNP
jgi:hypothetical protein